MTPKIILCLALVASNLSSHARGVRLWSDAELMAASDLVAVGRPITVKDLDESNSLGWDKSIGWSQLTFRGVETTFKVSEVLKGTPASNQIVLHHYRFEKVNPPNGPSLVEFIPGDTNEYVLYLINDGTNRYAPTSGQIDPMFHIKPPLTNSAAAAVSLRVVVIPSKTEVRVKENFKVALRVENPTTANQTVRVMSCSWDEEWKTSNTNISWIGWACTRNIARNVKIPPGGAYTNELEMLIPEPTSETTLSFRMGFTPMDSEKTFWSDEIIIGVAPQRATNKDLTKQIAEILTECQKIKHGMTRAEFLKVFTVEGGLSTAAHRTFVYRGCPYIKIDVDFTLSDPKRKMIEERPTDTIIKISKPYLDWSISD